MREAILSAGKTAYEANSSFINNIFKTLVNPEAVDPERDQYTELRISHGRAGIKNLSK